jgi:hypothetical protein
MPRRHPPDRAADLLGRKGIGAEQQLPGVPAGLGVFADFPDEVEDRRIGGAFRREWPDAACSQRRGDLDAARDERVACLLQRRAFDCLKAR